MADLPDWYTQVSGVEAEAYTIRGGADANKSATPTSRDVYLATDTKKLYICVADGAWTGFDASILVQGILTLYANLVGGGYKLTGIGAPTAATDAARKSEVDAVDAKLDDVSESEPTRAVDTEYQNGSKIRIVQISVSLDPNETAVLYTGPASPPVNVMANVKNGGNTDDIRASMTVVIPPNYYYLLETSVGTPAIAEWWEWDLH